MYTLRKTGKPNTLDYRVYYEKEGTPISSWHDIPLFANEEKTVLNMVVEIPRWTNAKFEVLTSNSPCYIWLMECHVWQISRDEFLNPIKQDTKKGKLRFVRNRFPYKGYIWNYGALPRVRSPFSKPSFEFIFLFIKNRPGKIPATPFPRRTPMETTIPLMHARSESKLPTVVRSSKSKSLVWCCSSTRGRQIGKSSSLMSMIHWLRSSMISTMLSRICPVCWAQRWNGSAFIRPLMESLWTKLLSKASLRIGGIWPEAFWIKLLWLFCWYFFLESFALKIIHECSEAWDKLINVKTPPEEISL